MIGVHPNAAGGMHWRDARGIRKAKRNACYCPGRGLGKVECPEWHEVKRKLFYNSSGSGVASPTGP